MRRTCASYSCFAMLWCLARMKIGNSPLLVLTAVWFCVHFVFQATRVPLLPLLLPAAGLVEGLGAGLGAGEVVRARLLALPLFFDGEVVRARLLPLAMLESLIHCRVLSFHFDGDPPTFTMPYELIRPMRLLVTVLARCHDFFWHWR